jgi:putative ABC transport system substrate-binding protein
MWCSVIGCIVTLTLSLLAASLATEAQPLAKVPRVGYFSDDSGSLGVTAFEPLAQGLRELGYLEGRHIVFEPRYAEGNTDVLPDLAAALVHSKVDVIVAYGTPAAKAAQHATRTIPIVALMGEPVEMGLVASLARPGGNLTGVSGQSAEAGRKRLELPKEAVPQASRVAVLWNPANPNKVLEWQETQRAAQALGVTLQSVEVRTPDDFERAFATLTRGRADALLTMTESLTLMHRRQIVDFTTQNRLPMLAAGRAFVEAGGLMSYGFRPQNVSRHLAVYVDKILKGAKPADLPVEQSMKFELILNRKTAQTLGITFPPTLLVWADEVIQ